MKELAKLFEGLVFYGTGGGGRAEAGLVLLDTHFGTDWTPTFTEPADLPGDAMVAATIVIGGRDPVDDVSSAERKTLGLPEQDLGLADRFVQSIEAMGRHLARPVEALAVVELGSLATAATLIAADRLSLPVLNADCTGRSIPELGLTKMDLVGRSATPVTLVDRFGGEVTISGSTGAAMADRLSRQVSRAVRGRGLAAIAYPGRLRDFSEGLVKNSILTAWNVGRILGGPQPVEQRLKDLLHFTGGRVVCRAQARETRWRSLEPYGFREFDYLLDGRGEHAGRDVRIFVKNEHHAVWIGETMTASSPAIIAVLDAKDLRPLTTLGDVTDGLEVLVVVCPALDDQWRGEAGHALLGPCRFDLDQDAVTIQ